MDTYICRNIFAILSPIEVVFFRTRIQTRTPYSVFRSTEYISLLITFHKTTKRRKISSRIYRFHILFVYMVDPIWLEVDRK